MKNKIISGTQILLVLIWAIASHMLGKGSGFNIFVFNILPIPNFPLMIVTFILIGIGSWLQKLKTINKKINEY